MVSLCLYWWKIESLLLKTRVLPTPVLYIPEIIDMSNLYVIFGKTFVNYSYSYMFHHHHHQISLQGHVWCLSCLGNVNLLIQLVQIVIIVCDLCVIIGKIYVYVSYLNIYIKYFSYNQFLFSYVCANENAIIFSTLKKNLLPSSWHLYICTF